MAEPRYILHRRLTPNGPIHGGFVWVDAPAMAEPVDDSAQQDTAPADVQQETQ